LKFHDHYIGFYHVFKQQMQSANDTSHQHKHFELESSNPVDTIPVAIFFTIEQLQSNDFVNAEFFYVCKVEDFDENSYLLFSISKDLDWNLWRRYSWYACGDASSHHEAANWMLEKTTKENENAFINGTFKKII